MKSKANVFNQCSREASDGSGHAAKGTIGGSDVMGMFAMSYTA